MRAAFALLDAEKRAEHGDVEQVAASSWVLLSTDSCGRMGWTATFFTDVSYCGTFSGCNWSVCGRLTRARWWKKKQIDIKHT
jgi:hypothetical protein